MELHELQDAVSGFLYPLKMGGELSEKGFQGLVCVLDNLEREWQAVELLPKAMLWEIHGLYLGVMAELECFRGDRQQLEVCAAKIGQSFSLILKGELSASRVPGVPRII